MTNLFTDDSQIIRCINYISEEKISLLKEVSFRYDRRLSTNLNNVYNRVQIWIMYTIPT